MSYLGAQPEVRDAAVKWSQEHGIAAAANKFSVSLETIRRWRRARGLSNSRRSMS